MHGAHVFLTALAMVLGVAAVTTVLFQKLRQPVVLGYLIAGLIVGPHTPIPLVADTVTIQTLAELGVILLMFSLGLEFSLRKLVQVGPTAGITAVIQCGLMIWLGVVVGRAFGWTGKEGLFTGALIAISSTTIIAKAFDENGVGGKLRQLVVGVLIVEDLIAILLMATLTAVSSGSGLSTVDLAAMVGKLVAFLLGLVGVGLLVVPRAVRAIVRLRRSETTLVASIGLCFAVALLAQAFGYSVALGAFMAGSLVAESGEAKEIEHLIQPVKDVFAAIFFVSVGMLMDPELIARNWLPILVLTLVVVVGKVVSVTLGAFLTGNGTRLSVQAGMSLAQIGEFSFIIATLGLSLGATRDFLYPVAVTVSAITTLSTPFLIRSSGTAANWVDRKLPARLQTVTALYGSWVEALRSPSRTPRASSGLRRAAFLLFGDAACLAGIVICMALFGDWAAKDLSVRLGLREELTRVGLLAGAVVFAVPFLVGIVRLARRIGVTLAEWALPPAREGAPDLALAPRRVMVVTFQLLCVLGVGIPLLAITQPFLAGYQAALVILGLTLVLGIVFWRRAFSLQGHVRAGAEVILEALKAQSHAQASTDDALVEVRGLLPGLGEPVSHRLAPGSPAIGQTLAALNLRGQTGATVLALKRGQEGLMVPTAHDVLQEGDVLALAGSHESIDAAKAVLDGTTPPGATPAEPVA